VKVVFCTKIKRDVLTENQISCDTQEEWVRNLWNTTDDAKARKSCSKIKMQFFFFTFTEWCIMNLFQRVKQLMLHFMCKLTRLY